MKLAERKQTEAVQNQEQRVSYVAPRATIRETAEGYVLQAEMPGVSRAGLEVTVENLELTITGHRSDPNPPAEFLHRESNRRDYRRVFELDPSIDSSRIAARVENGVLTLTLPKAEAVKPRKIEVSG